MIGGNKMPDSKVLNTKVYDTLPEGWKRINGAMTAPRGYYWACNRKSRWSGEYERGLVREKT